MRNRKYLDDVHEMPCAVTGFVGNEFEGIDPAHIRYGFFGASMKPPDDDVIPLKHTLHQKQHSMPEVEFWLEVFNEHPDFAMRCLKAYARQNFREWEQEHGN